MRTLVAGLVGAVALTATGANAQYFGHEYEGTQAPIREGEQPVIPLDTKDPSYNVWRTPRDDLQTGREPGTFNPNRFPFGMSWQGMPTIGLHAQCHELAVVVARSVSGSAGDGAADAWCC